MKIVVTGAGGMIGGHLVLNLLRMGEDVRAVDNKPLNEWWQVHELASNVVMDLRDVAACRSLSRDAERVYHLAADMGGIFHIEAHRADNAFNSLITMNMLRASAEVGARMFLASSACIYPDYRQADTIAPALKESDAFPAMAEPGYGWSKLFDELLCRYVYEDWGLETRIARYHNIYGTCYDDATEVLTIDGFKLFCDLKDDDLLATRTAEGYLEYEPILARQCRWYSGPMVRLKSRSYDLLVTPEHDVAIVHNRHDQKLIKVPAREIRGTGSGEFMVRHALWRGKEVESFLLPDVPFEPSQPYPRRNRGGGVSIMRQARTKRGCTVAMDDWLEFLGWYLAEGSACRVARGTRGDLYCVDIRQYDEVHRQEIAAVIRRMGFHPSIQDGRIKIFSKVLYTVLAPLGKSGDEYIPAYARALSSRQLRILFTAMTKGDGLGDGSSFMAYYTKSSQLRDDVTEVALKLGMAVTTSFRPADVARRKGPIHNLSISDDNVTHKIATTNVWNEAYSGFVYDVTVPNHIIFVRRNGRVVWSGNCGTWDGGREKAPAALCRKIAVARLTNERTVTIAGDGHQTRSFCWVGDCIEGTHRLMESECREPLNIGSGELIAIDDLALLIAQIAGVEVTLAHDLTAPQGVRGRSSDNEMIKRVLGWEPSTPLRDGLAVTYGWIYDQVRAKLCL